MFMSVLSPACSLDLSKRVGRVSFVLGRFEVELSPVQVDPTGQ